MAQRRPRTARQVPRLIHVLPPRRGQEPPSGPSRRDVLRRWEELEWWSCVYCDRSFGQRVALEIDHIRPLASGGLHEWSNLAPSCARCNRAKADTDVAAWLASSLVTAL
ncbi:HNH endonuclease [Streptomyces sp. NRRL F-5630]|uniref:HNH endonuclease n=1 Tax=Streptomyces sp. NRRL F-5630 TaxID=1463864 RepID=UPI003B639967